MELMVKKFRTALGGFNRQDVQQYIQQVTAAYKKETFDLKDRLEEAERRRDELEDILSGLETERGSAVEESRRVRESLDSSTRDLVRLRGELSETESKLLVARGELEHLQLQVKELAPMADNYAQLKDRVATVELEAHCKAQSIIDQGMEEADRLREDARRWLEGVLAQYSTLRHAMETLLEQVQAIGQVSERFDTLEWEAGQLREQGGLE